MDKEQIEELAGLIFDYTEPAVLGASDVAEIIYDTGYHKTIWHKIAEKDLPQQKGNYLCYVHIVGYDRHNELIDGYGYSVEFFDTGFCALNKSVIAWTELPTYKE